MSEASTFHKRVHARLREVFGEPDNSMGRDDHWSLRSGPFKPAINILVDGGADSPAVWIFDPNVNDNGVLRKAVRNEADLDNIIAHIQDRLNQAPS